VVVSYFYWVLSKTVKKGICESVKASIEQNAQDCARHPTIGMKLARMIISSMSSVLCVGGDPIAYLGVVGLSCFGHHPLFEWIAARTRVKELD
jgi:hypothetical protein